MFPPFVNLEWVAKGLDTAEFFANRFSKDPSTKVGAVIMNKRKRIVGFGYNGFPDRIPDAPHRLADRTLKNEDTIHAEVNAVLNATASVEGCALFVNFPPCGDCAKFVIQAGIDVVHYLALDPDSGFAERWACSMDRAQSAFKRAGVPMIGWRRVPEVVDGYGETNAGIEQIDR